MTPEGWRASRIGEVADLFNGKASGTGGTWLRVFKTRHVYDGYLRLSDFAFAPDEKAALVPPATYLRSGDTLTPNMAHGTIGRVAFARDVGDRWTVDGQVTVIRPKDSSVLGRYVFDWMSRPQSKQLLVSMEKGGAFDELRGQTHIYRQDIASIPILVPPLPEQRKIAAILSSVDDAIEATQAVIDQLGVVKKAMMAELLTRGLPGRHTRFKQTEIGEVPEEWDVVPLQALVASIDAGWSPACEPAPAREDEWGVLKVSAVSWGEFRPEENKRLPSGLDPRPSAEVRSGDLLVSRANTPQLVGRCVLVGETRPRLMLSDKLLRLRVDDGATCPGFLRLALETPIARQQIEDAATGSSRSMKNISQEKLRALAVPKPPLDEQYTIADTFQSVAARINSEHAALGCITALKNALMSVLLTGELRVTPDGDAV